MKAIITDYDYTLSDKFLTVEFLHLLEEKGVIQGYKKEYKGLIDSYRKGEVSYNDFVATDMDFIKKYLKGVEYTKIIETIREDFNPEKNIFNWSKQIRDTFKQDEWLFIVISSTMDLLLESVQDILEFDSYYCSTYEIKDKKFTGEFKCQVKSEEKGKYVKMLSKDLDYLVVVGDAPGDFEMMKYANSAYLFEPDQYTINKLDDMECKIIDRDNALKTLQKEV